MLVLSHRLFFNILLVSIKTNQHPETKKKKKEALSIPYTDTLD